MNTLEVNDEFSPFIKAIGAGKRSGRYLSEHEAFTAMSMVLRDKVSPEQKGAFLMLLRVREESIEELTGFVRACREMLESIPQNNYKRPYVDIDIACYAGKRRQLPWFLLSLALLHQNGHRLFIHGTAEPHSTRLYVKDALSQLGLLQNLQATSIKHACQLLDTRNIAYMDLADIHPTLNNIIQLREAFGLRSCANTLARLLNPFDAKYAVQGVHHQGVDVKHMGIAANLRDKNVLCFRGEGGEPEVNPSIVTSLHFYQDSCRALTQCEMQAKQSWQIKPKTLDLSCLYACWSENESSDRQRQYGVNTVISTLAPIIMMVESCAIEDAEELAIKWWQQRSRTEFLSVAVSEGAAGYFQSIE
jgi:anthranilate phosphoribosyltransferase